MDPHYEKYRQLSLNISRYRKLKGWTQAFLADKVHISPGHLSHIEAPKMVASFSVGVLFDIADALDVEVKDLFEFKNDANTPRG